MIELKDQIGRTISLAKNAKAIVSLVPSLTELLADLHLSTEVVGVTKFCVHPKNWKAEKKIVGGTKQFHIDRIRQLTPDLIIANKEENTKEAIEELSELYTVYVSDIQQLDDCYQCITDIGLLTGREEASSQLVSSIKEAFNKLPKFNRSPKVVYCIWKDPWMFAGTDTFINTMLHQAGFSNAIADHRYPSCSLQEIAAIGPDIIFLSSEPYPFKQQHIDDLNHQFPDSKISLVDGELFSWYGSRLLQFPSYIALLRKQLNAH